MATSIDKKTCNILMGGETGSGKSSVVNLIFDDERAVISDKPIGCTKDFGFHPGNPDGVEDLYLNIYDTVGFGESVEGTVPMAQACEKLHQLLKLISEKDGIHLLLFCVKMGRLTQAAKENYKIFVEDMCDSKVPCILVVTCCEQEDNLGSWWEQYKDVIRKQLTYRVDKGISVTAKKNGKHFSQDAYNESRRNLINAIKECATTMPYYPDSKRKKFRHYLKSLGLINCFHQPDAFKQYLEEPMENSQDEEEEYQAPTPFSDSPTPAPIIDNKSRLKNPHRIEVILEHRKWQSNFLRKRDNRVLTIPFSTDKSLLKKQMVRSLIGLTPITLREMNLKKDHVYNGNVLSVTIIEQAYSWIPSIHLVIEDQHFDCKKICVYGFPEDQGEHLISQVLTIGSKMHIINPYLQLGKIDLKTLIRIDDFSSIVMQNESEHIINMCRCCGKANARHVCSKCKRAYYCTIECEIMDWQLYKHKLICKTQ